MRRLAAISLLAIACASRLAAADEVPSPAQYLKIMTESKLSYSIGAAVKTPMEPTTCPRRDESMRLIADGNKKKLVPWPLKPEAQKAFQEGEALFQAQKYDEAGAAYQRAIAADPEMAAAYLTYGDTLLFGAKPDAAAALEQYRKGIALDPTLPSAHFFASTALLRLGRSDEAREEIIKALTSYPSYDAIMKNANALPAQLHIEPIVRHPFEPPAGLVGVRHGKTIEIAMAPEGKWLGYSLCKAAWANEPQFASEHSAGGWSLSEERACVVNEFLARYNAIESTLTKEKKANGTANPSVTQAEIIAAADPWETHMIDVMANHLLDGYILFEIIGNHCPLSMSMLDETPLQSVEGYIRRYVIVAR